LASSVGDGLACSHGNCAGADSGMHPLTRQHVCAAGCPPCCEAQCPPADAGDQH
jgi:hypothetical protein